MRSIVGAIKPAKFRIIIYRRLRILQKKKRFLYVREQFGPLFMFAVCFFVAFCECDLLNAAHAQSDMHCCRMVRHNNSTAVILDRG